MREWMWRTPFYSKSGIFLPNIFLKGPTRLVKIHILSFFRKMFFTVICKSIHVLWCFDRFNGVIPRLPKYIEFYPEHHICFEIYFGNFLNDKNEYKEINWQLPCTVNPVSPSIHSDPVRSVEGILYTSKMLSALRTGL